MFDLGMTEIFVIAVLAILVIAPKDLPAAMRTVAQTMAKAKRMWRNVQREFDQALRVDELNDVRRQVADIRRTTDAEFMKSMQAPRTMPRSTLPKATPAAAEATDADAGTTATPPDDTAIDGVSPMKQAEGPAPSTPSQPDESAAETVEVDTETSPDIRPVAAKA